jgi:hypothetical protein
MNEKEQMAATINTARQRAKGDKGRRKNKLKRKLRYTKKH